MSPVSRRCGLVLLAGLVSVAAACHTWHVPPLAPEALLAAPSKPSIARFTLRDSTRVVLRQPRLAGDSVTGTPAGSERGTIRTLPLAEVSEIALRRFSPGKTIGLVAAGFAGLYAVAFIGCEATDCAGVDFGDASAVR